MFAYQKYRTRTFFQFDEWKIVVIKNFVLSNSHTPPVISVVMSVHNSEKYLREAVESILNQTFKDFEFIIIDDGSVDGSKEILQEYAAKDARIRLVSRENRGLTKSLNEGLALAHGEFIARMDADDISLPQRFEIQVEFLSKNPSVVASGCGVRYINSKGVPLFVRQLPQKHDEIEKCHCTTQGGFIIHPSVMIRHDAIKIIQGYDESFAKAQDYDLWFRLGAIGQLINLPQVLLEYRYHPLAITQNCQNEQSSCRESILTRELKIRNLASPLPLPFQYQLHMTNPEWLLAAAARSGCVRTTFTCSMAILIRNMMGIVRCIYFMWRVWLVKRTI